MARTLTYDSAERLFNIVGGIRIFTRHINVEWPEDQTPEEGSSSASNTVNVNHYKLYENHPLASLFGKYEDEPLWDGFEEAIRNLREEDNAIIE
ncbi:MAG TPA: hypothetical protein VGX24_04665 [Pyrinomonadaceae bacterium]|nr:hypothetical protein [Pyrinomonadaceae bacterium]